MTEAEFKNPLGWKAPPNMHYWLPGGGSACGKTEEQLQKSNAYVTTHEKNVTCRKCLEALTPSPGRGLGFAASLEPLSRVGRRIVPRALRP